MTKTLCIAILVAGFGCATTETTATTWTAPTGYVESGQVDSVREVVRRVNGNPAGGALAGGLIGGLLSHRLLGAAAGAAIGAAASSGSAVHRTYEVRVHFDDGQYGLFVYDGYSPVRPGDHVVLENGQLELS